MIDPALFGFVLVRPRNPNNIGAVARAMANFGLDDLRLVEPYAPAWEESRAAAAGASVLKGARATTLAEAVCDSALVLGTGDGRRAVRRPVVSLPDLAAYLRENLPDGGRCSILFGSEKTGLRNAELEHCRAVVRIPTRAGAPSMNLGQAAAAIAYELARSKGGEPARRPRLAPANAGQREDLVQWALRAMDRVGYLKETPRASKAARLRRALQRWDLPREDAGLLRALLKRVAAPEAAGPRSSSL
ncbi:MAG TPA: TrmH family RNA methyltransferase [Elusimicrobiota bacterium]|jgi:tRNA/rRNA methyltransferase|nr:TrmH family RNA methyltransferase [Elusimicrobiota bacterium]